MRKSILSLAVVLATANFALAVPFNGNALNYTYSGSTNGDFTSPTVLGGQGNSNTLVFNTAQFSTNASFGATDTATGDVTLNIATNPFYYLAGIQVAAFGNWSMTDPTQGDATSRVTIEIDWSATDNDTGAFKSTSFVPSVGNIFPLDYSAGSQTNSGNYTGFTALGLNGTVPPFLGQDVSINLSALVEAIASPDGTAFANLFTTAMEIELFFVPEPGTIALLGLGGIALIRRRR